MIYKLAIYPELPRRKRRRLEILTQSRLKLRQVCRRAHFLRYVIGLRPVAQAEALVLGTLVHLLLEIYWVRRMGVPVEARVGELLSAADLALDAADPFVAAKARAMAEGYERHWAGAPYRPLAVESEFYTELPHPHRFAHAAGLCDCAGGLASGGSRLWQIGGKLDVLVEDFDSGERWVMEHKTSSEDIATGSPYFQALRLDRQLSLYTLGARALGHDVVGTIYDVLATPQQRPLKATPEEARKFTKEGRLYANQRETDETPDEYYGRLAAAIGGVERVWYAREPIYRTEADLHAALVDIWQIGAEMRREELDGVAPMSPAMCFHWHRPCEYFDLCTGAADPTDERLYQISQQPHAELARVPA